MPAAAKEHQHSEAAEQRGPLVARVVRWASNVARGKDDRRNTLIKAEFVEGGTIGPVPKER